MNSEELIKIYKLKQKPIRDVNDLGKRLVGTRDGYFYYTESFRQNFDCIMNDYAHKQQEIDRLNNNWNKLAEYILSKVSIGGSSVDNAIRVHNCQDILDKMKEIKDSDKE